MKVLLVFVCLLATTLAITLDEAFQRCKGIRREDLEPCLINLINEMRPLIHEGIPELGLIGIDIDAEPMNFDRKHGSSYVKASYEQMKIKGFNEFEMKDLEIDYDKRIARWTVLIPQVLLTSRYFMDAKIAYFPLHGNGTCWHKADNFMISGVSKFGVEKINGELRLQEVDTDMDFNYGKLSLRMNNLFNGDPILQEAASVFLDSNADLLIEEMRPQTKKVFRQMTGNTINKVLARIKLDDLAGSEHIRKAFNLRD